MAMKRGLFEGYWKWAFPLPYQQVDDLISNPQVSGIVPYCSNFLVQSTRLNHAVALSEESSQHEDGASTKKMWLQRGFFGKGQVCIDGSGAEYVFDYLQVL